MTYLKTNIIHAISTAVFVLVAATMLSIGMSTLGFVINFLVFPGLLLVAAAACFALDRGLINLFDKRHRFIA